MRLHIIFIARASLLAIVLMVTAACGASEDADGRLSVVASIYPLGFFAEQVGGDLAAVSVLVGPGVEAHGFEPTASDLRTIGAADLVVMNGLELEPWLERALEALDENAEQVVVEAADESQAVEGLAHDHGGEEEGRAEGEHRGEEGEEHEEGELQVEELDPHMWLDPVLAITQVERIRDALIEVDADNADVYRANAAAIIDELNKLHAEFTEGLANCKQDHFVTSHAAHAYLAARYGAEQIPITGLSPEAEPSPRQLAEITDRVAELGLGYVLVEPVLSGGLEQTVASEAGIELIPFHAIGSVTEAELKAHGDYFGLMRNNLASLKLALECA